MDRAIRFLLPVLIVVGALAVAASVTAEDVGVPVALQADLLARAAAYDRHLRDRGGEPMIVVILVRSGKADSERAAAQMAASLGAMPAIAGRKHREDRVPYRSAVEVAAVCRSLRPGILYLAPGLGGEIPAIAAALKGIDVLSATGTASYVPQGVVLGFDLQSGKPRLLVHLGQALEQKVAFEPTFLRLAKVVDR